MLTELAHALVGHLQVGKILHGKDQLLNHGKTLEGQGTLLGLPKVPFPSLYVQSYVVTLFILGEQSLSKTVDMKEETLTEGIEPQGFWPKFFANGLF